VIQRFTGAPRNFAGTSLHKGVGVGDILHGNFHRSARVHESTLAKRRSKLSVLRNAMKLSTAQFKVGLSRQAARSRVARNPFSGELKVYLFQVVHPFVTITCYCSRFTPLIDPVVHARAINSHVIREGKSVIKIATFFRSSFWHLYWTFLRSCRAYIYVNIKRVWNDRF